MGNKKPQSADIAIIGVSALFSGSKDKDAYWENILSKADNVTIAPDSWLKPWYDPVLAGKTLDSGRIKTRRVGLIGDLAVFNPLDFGIPPKAVEGDPAHYLALKFAADALKDANYQTRPFDRRRVGVIVGHGTNPNRGDVGGFQYGFAIEQTIGILEQLLPELDDSDLTDVREALKKGLPKMEIEQAPTLISNVITGRIANRLDLMGPNYMVDAACASGLIAVDLGMRDLLSDRCDMMVVGGVQASMPAQIYMLFETLGALSPTHIRPFDKDANGTLLGEGVGFVVLKRLPDAIRDGDKIYAVLKGVGTASDGKAAGLLAPRLEGEILAIRRAYEQTGIDPETIGLIETHGTGIPLGDTTEIAALKEVFGSRKGSIPTCAIGSVKSMIGHCIPAAGVASLIKVALSLHYKVLPPTLCGIPNPELGIESTPFYVNTELRPWLDGSEVPRRAGINAFGFGGINAHAILEEYRDLNTDSMLAVGKWLTGGSGKLQESGTQGEHASSVRSAAEGLPLDDLVLKQWPFELVVLSGGHREQILSEIEATLSYLEGQVDPSLADLAYTKSLEINGNVRLAVVARDIAELTQKLTFLKEKIERGKHSIRSSRKGIYYSEKKPAQGKLAFLFSSEGSQYPNMLQDLCFYFPKVRKWFEFLDTVFPRQPRPGECVFPPPTCVPDDERKRLEALLFAGDLATESVSTASQALYELLRDLGVNCDIFVGHSAGEHAALRASRMAGTGSMEQLKAEMRLLNSVYHELEEGKGIAAGKILSVAALDYEAIDGLLSEFRETLFLVADNCPSQVILFAKDVSSKSVVDRIVSLRGIYTELPFGRAYHTPLFNEGVAALKRFYENEIEPGEDHGTVYSCSTAAPYPLHKEAAFDVAAEQWAKPVRFRETVEELYRENVRIFVELGASNSLTAFVENILKGKDYVAVASNIRGKSALEQLLHLLGNLFIQNVDIKLPSMYEHRQVRRIRPESRQQKAKPAIQMVLSTALPMLSLGTDDVKKAQERRIPATEKLAIQPKGPQRTNMDAVVADHFDLMNLFLQSQANIAQAGGAKPNPVQESRNRDV